MLPRTHAGSPWKGNWWQTRSLSSSSRLLPGENTQGICWNIALPIVGGGAFYKRRNMGWNCFLEFPRRGSHVSPLVAIINKMAAAMATTRVPQPATSGPGGS